MKIVKLAPLSPDPLTLRYRASARLRDVRGQPHVVRGLRAYLRRPSARGFLFYGETGTGKTFTAWALANELGVDLKLKEMGGLFSIASGEQTAESVRERLWNCRYTSLYGSGWKVVIVNEADFMSPAAQMVWLDGLESLPSRTAIVFTTNSKAKLATRFIDRCEHYEFRAECAELRPGAQALVNQIWRRETGGNQAPTLAQLGFTATVGYLSFRDILQRLETQLRYVERRAA